jgi:hypothetical protein
MNLTKAHIQALPESAFDNIDTLRNAIFHKYSVTVSVETAHVILREFTNT